MGRAAGMTGSERAEMGVLDPVFRAEKPYFTCLTGLTNALYEPHTEVNEAICGLALSVIESVGVQYFLFAGSMVGFMRNGKVPPWMDDTDIMVLEDQIPVFEAEAVPRLRACGFEVKRPHAHMAAGGYHVLAQRAGWKRDVTATFAAGHIVRVPWAQVDAFYSRVNARGHLENPGSWGLYHFKKIPADWVRPGVWITLGGRRMRAFSRWRDDIRAEYGDVENNLVVATHDRVFLDLRNIPYAIVDAEFEDRLVIARANGLPSSGLEALRAHSPVAGRCLVANMGESLDSMVRRCLDNSADELVLVGPRQFYWAMDLKRLLPAINLIADVPDGINPGRISHFGHLYAEIRTKNAAVRAQISSQIAEISAVGREVAGRMA